MKTKPKPQPKPTYFLWERLEDGSETIVLGRTDNGFLCFGLSKEEAKRNAEEFRQQGRTIRIAPSR